MFELQPLEQRVMLSAEALGTGLVPPIWAHLHTTAIVESSVAVAAETSVAAGAVDAVSGDDDWFPTAASGAAVTTGADVGAANAVETTPDAIAPDPGPVSVLATTTMSMTATTTTADAPLVVAPTGTVFAVETIIPVNTYANGPPPGEAQVIGPTSDTSTERAAVTGADLADTFSTALAGLDAALVTWGAFFDLDTIDWAGLNLPEVSLPVVPDTLGDLFGLDAVLESAVLPDFTAETSIDGFVNALGAAGFSITAIDGGYASASTTIAATTGTSLLEGSYTLSIASGFGVDGGYGGDSFNDSTAAVLSGLASGVDLDGAITWSGDLSLTLGFVLDASDGLLLTGDSALALTVNGSGTLAGSGTAGGAATTFDGTAEASLTIALGFINPAASYTVSDFTAANLVATASGTADLSLRFAAGPANFTFAGSYLVTADPAARTVAQSYALSLAGQLTLPGVTAADGTTAGVISLTGAYDSGTTTWTLSGTASGLKLLGLELTAVSAEATVTSGAFSGSFAASMNADFLSTGGASAQIDLSATYDRSTVGVTGTLSVASLSFGGTGPEALFTATDFSGTVTLTGDIAAGTLTGGLALSAGSATLLPGGSSFTAAVTDGDDGDTLGLAGSYDFNTQVLTVTVDQLDVVMPDVLTVSMASVAVTYDRKNTDPAQTIASAATVTIELTALQETGKDPPTATVANLTIRQNGFAFDSASVNLGDHTIGGIVEVASLAVTLTDVDYTVGETPSGVLGLAADSATLFPGSAATATLTGLSGQFDVASKSFQLSITALDAAIGDLLTFTATGVAFGYDPTGPPSQTVFAVDALTVAVPSASVTGTLTGLEVTAAGDFSAVSLALDTSGLTDALGIGDFLPFNVDTMDAVFAGDTNGNGVRDEGEVFSLTAFDLTVTGAFDFEKLGSLPFTPILQIGDSELSAAGTNSFTFTVSVGAGGIAPKDIGPITIGFSDLKIGDTAVLAGSLTLGGYQDGVFVADFSGALQLVASNAMGNVSGDASITVSGTFTGGVLDLTGAFNVSFTYGDDVSVVNAVLGFEMTVSAGSGFTLALDHLALTSGSVESVTLSFGSLMTLAATGATFDFNATGSDAVATFASLSATFPGLGDLTGTATNFGFGADGTLLTFDGFGVEVSADASALKWPDWVPITISRLAVQWTDFAADPTDFTLILSASVDSLNGLDALTVSGTVDGVVIDLGLLQEGKFPITDLDAVSISVSGNAFGGTVSGTLVIGILKLDADGNILTSFDSTPVEQRILYGAVEASFEFGGTAGFEIRIGVSELGPLQVYLSVSAPVILEPISGLAITDFRAGVTFDSTLSDISDPFDLLNSEFTPAAEQTAAEWLDALQTAVADQAANSTGGDFWAVFDQPMVIQGGATLYSAYASTTTFRADIDIIFDTEGRVVVNARGTFADSFSMNFRLYANLTEIQSNGTFLFLAEEPEDPTLITYYGALQFKFLAADGSAASSASQASAFYLSVSGGAIGELDGVGSITLDATLTLTLTATQTEIDFSGSLSMAGLGDAITTAGTFVIEKSGSATKLYGVAVVDVSFEQLESKGIIAAGTALLEINTTGSDITTSMTLPGGSPTSYTLAAQSFVVVVDGSLQVQESGSDLFYMEGLFVFSLNAEGLDLLVDGKVLIGDTGNPTATLSTTSYFAIRAAGVAAKIDLTLVGSFGAGAADLAVDATFQLIFNTAKQDISYDLPAGVTLSDGSTAVTVSGTSPAGKKEVYLYLDITGSLTIADTFELTDGHFSLTITPSLLSLSVAATFTLKAGSTSLLTYGVSGGFEITSAGVAATLSLSLQTNAPSSQGWSIDGTATMQFNTRSSSATVAGVTLAAKTYRVAVAGTLTIGELDLVGSFEFQLSGSTVNVTVDATLTIKAGSTQILKLTVAGAMSINHQGLAAFIEVALSAGPSSGAGWSLDADFYLAINTRSSSVTLDGAYLGAGLLQIYISGSLTASGFAFSGTFELTVVDSSVTIAASAKITVAGISLDVSGAFGVYSDGIAFKLSLSSSELKTSILTVKGTFTIAVNTTGSTRFSIARKSGYLAVSDVQVTLAGFTISGSLTISSDGTITVPSSDPLTLSILGQTAKFYGSVDLSTGYFDLNAAISISIGSSSVAQISGTLNLNLYRKKVNGSTSAGLNGTFSASLYGFGLKIASLAGSTSISSDGAFSLSVSVDFTLHSFVSISATISIEVDSSRNLALSISGQFSIFGKFKASVGGWASSSSGHWRLWGSASASFGSSSLGASLAVSVALSNYTTDTVSISGKGWASVKVLGISFGIEGSFSATLTGETASVKVSGSAHAGFIKVSASETVHMDFSTGKIWLSNIAGGLVYFDVNLNGVLDAGEPFTYADAEGVFRFDQPVDNLPDGQDERTVLAALDTNGDGLLTADEGLFRLFGGTLIADGSAPSGVVDLPEGVLSGTSDYADATVFFDANLNGELDAAEFYVTTSATGAYSFQDVFLPVDFSINHLGSLESYDRNANGVIDPDEGVLILTGGSGINDGLAPSGPELLGSPVGHTIFAGATIFLDLNGNATLDVGEPATTAAADGFYQFGDDHNAVETAALGDLTDQDINFDGRIDGDEGVLVVTGGWYVTVTDGLPVRSGAVATPVVLEDVATTGMVGIADGLVFLDTNGNRVRDAGEVAVTSNEFGRYSFSAETRAASSNLGALAPFDANGNGEIDTAEGVLAYVGGLRIGDDPGSDGENAHELFAANHPVGVLDWSDATVFLDLNGNGAPDAGEVSTTTDAGGYYSFLDASDFGSELGALAVYDLNGNHRLDPAEGVFVIEGGTDLDTGLTNARTLTVLAVNYGTPFSTEISPLSEVLTYLVLDGMSQTDANAVLINAFGLPRTTDVLTYDVDLATTSAARGESLAKLLSIIAESGGEILFSLAEQSAVTPASATATRAVDSAGDNGLTRGQAEDFMLLAFARLLRDADLVDADVALVTDEAGNLLASPAVLAIHDSDLLQHLLGDAIVLAGVTPPPTAQLVAAATALHNLVDRVQALGDAGIADLASALGRVNLFVREVFHPALDGLFRGTTSVEAFSAAFTPDGIRDQIRTVDLPGTNSAPTIGPLSDVTVPDYGSQTPLTAAFTVGDPDGLADEVDVQVSADNAFLLPAGAITVSGDGVARSLTYQPVAGRWGTATITLTADDGQSADGTNLTITTFTVTVTYTYADFMQSRAHDAAAARFDAEAEVRAAAARAAATELAATLSAWRAEQDSAGETPGLELSGAQDAPLVAQVSLAAATTPRDLSGL